MQTLFDRAVQDERLFAIGLCARRRHGLLRRTGGFPATVELPTARKIGRSSPIRGCAIEGGPVHVGVHPVVGDDGADRRSWCCCTT